MHHQCSIALIAATNVRSVASGAGGNCCAGALAWVERDSADILLSTWLVEEPRRSSAVCSRSRMIVPLVPNDFAIPRKPLPLIVGNEP